MKSVKKKVLFRQEENENKKREILFFQTLYFSFNSVQHRSKIIHEIFIIKIILIIINDKKINTTDSGRYKVGPRGGCVCV